MSILSDPSNFYLIPANEQQIITTYENNYLEWGLSLGLSLQHYMNRELELGNCRFVKNRRTVWLLRLKASSATDEPSSQLKDAIFAQCETYSRPGCVYDTKTQHSHFVTCYSIDSVFVSPQFRGKGYASIMVKLLREHLISLTQHSEKPYVLSNLYSDVGPKFYAKFGWKVFDSKEWVIDLPPRSTTASIKKTSLARVGLGKLSPTHLHKGTSHIPVPPPGPSASNGMATAAVVTGMAHTPATEVSDEESEEPDIVGLLCDILGPTWELAACPDLQSERLHLVPLDGSRSTSDDFLEQNFEQEERARAIGRIDPHYTQFPVASLGTVEVDFVLGMKDTGVLSPPSSGGSEDAFGDQLTVSTPIAIPPTPNSSASSAAMSMSISPPDDGALLTPPSIEPIPPLPSPAPALKAVLFPTLDCFQWHWSRSRFYAQAYHLAPFNWVGLVQRSRHTGPAASFSKLLFWSLDLPEKKLLVLHWRFPEQEWTGPIKKALIAIARHYSMTRITVWDSESNQASYMTFPATSTTAANFGSYLSETHPTVATSSSSPMEVEFGPMLSPHRDEDDTLHWQLEDRHESLSSLGVWSSSCSPDGLGEYTHWECNQKIFWV